VRASWSLGELARAAAALAERLDEEDLVEGDGVGLAAAPGPAFLAGYLALRRLGAVPVLCDSVRPTPDRLAALDRIGTVALLTAADGWGEAAAWSYERRAAPGSRPLDPDWGAVKLSSGSTGEPRGIAARSEALLADEAQLSATMGVGADDRAVAAVSLAHSYGFSSLALPVLVRGTCLLIPDEGSPLAPLAVASTLGATFLPTVPAYVAGLVRLLALELPPSLRLVIAAGAPLAPETAATFRVRTGRPVHVFYGASECGGITFDHVGDAAERGTVGSPVAGVHLEIDPATSRLRVRSPAVAERYLPAGSEDLAGGAFLAGDRAQWDNGEIRLLGRSDDMVIVRGRNVQPHEVERVLRELAGVDDVCVFGVDGPDGPRSVLRAVVANRGRALDPGRIAAHCRARLAEHKVPRSILVVDELPLTGRGKLDRAALAALSAPQERDGGRGR